MFDLEVCPSDLVIQKTSASISQRSAHCLVFPLVKNLRLLNSSWFYFWMSSLWSESWINHKRRLFDWEPHENVLKVSNKLNRFNYCSFDRSLRLHQEQCLKHPMTHIVLTGQPFVRDGFVSTVMWSMLVMPGQRSQAPWNLLRSVQWLISFTIEIGCDMLGIENFRKSTVSKTMVFILFQIPLQRGAPRDCYKKCFIVPRGFEQDLLMDPSARFQAIPWCFIMEPMDCGSLMTWRCWACNEGSTRSWDWMPWINWY